MQCGPLTVSDRFDWLGPLTGDKLGGSLNLPATSTALPLSHLGEQARPNSYGRQEPSDGAAVRESIQRKNGGGYLSGMSDSDAYRRRYPGESEQRNSYSSDAWSQSRYGSPSSRYDSPSSRYDTPSSRYDGPSSRYDTAAATRFGGRYGDDSSAPLGRGGGSKYQSKAHPSRWSYQYQDYYDYENDGQPDQEPAQPHDQPNRPQPGRNPPPDASTLAAPSALQGNFLS